MSLCVKFMHYWFILLVKLMYRCYFVQHMCLEVKRGKKKLENCIFWLIWRLFKFDLGHTGLTMAILRSPWPNCDCNSHIEITMATHWFLLQNFTMAILSSPQSCSRHHNHIEMTMAVQWLLWILWRWPHPIYHDQAWIFSQKFTTVVVCGMLLCGA